MADADPSTPILELTGGPLDPMALWAVMCHPHNKAQQRELLNAYSAFVVCELAKQVNQDTVTINRATLEAVVDSPSFGALSAGAAKEARGGMLAGEVLLWVLSMQVTGVSEPSLGKALFLMERENRGRNYRDGTRMPTSQRTIRKRYQEFEPVAHLWASFVLTSPILEEEESATDEDIAEMFFGVELASFLTTAEGLRQFAETAILTRTKTPLVKPRTLYTIPQTYLGDTTLEFKPELADKIRKDLTAYKNRKRLVS